MKLKHLMRKIFYSTWVEIRVDYKDIPIIDKPAYQVVELLGKRYLVYKKYRKYKVNSIEVKGNKMIIKIIK